VNLTLELLLYIGIKNTQMKIAKNKMIVKNKLKILLIINASLLKKKKNI